MPVMLRALLCAIATVVPLGCSPGGVATPLVTDARVTVLLDGQPRCGGVHLGGGWVLTAQHCVQFGHEDLTIDLNRLSIRAGGVVRSVRSVTGRRSYYGSLGDLARGDLAVVRVDAGVGWSASQIGLSLPGEHQAVYVLAPRGVLPTTVRAAEAGSIYTGGVTCEGDSGGGLVDQHGTVIGVASWRTSVLCGQGLSVHTAVAPHREWIERVTGRDLTRHPSD